MTVNHDIAISCPLDNAVCIGTDPAPLLSALEDLGIATMGTCEELETGYMSLEFQTADDAEEFLTLLMVALDCRHVRDPEADERLTSRMLGTECFDDSQAWTYQALPLDTQSYLDPGPDTPRTKSAMLSAITLKIAIKFPSEDYPRVLELITGRSKLSWCCR